FSGSSGGLSLDLGRLDASHLTYVQVSNIMGGRWRPAVSMALKRILTPSETRVRYVVWRQAKDFRVVAVSSLLAAPRSTKFSIWRTRTAPSDVAEVAMIPPPISRGNTDLSAA